MTPAKVDLIVIGGGSGGARAARKAGEAGRSVILAETDSLGGTCVNRGCVPKKLLSYATHLGDALDYAKFYGWETAGMDKSMNWQRLRDNIAANIAHLNQVYANLLTDAGVTVLAGHATITSPTSVRVNDIDYEATDILVATGAKPSVPPTPGMLEHAITSDDVFELPELPGRMAIAGAGYIAVEFACIMAGLGVQTTLVHRGPTILKNFDSSIQRHLLEEMRHNKVELLLDNAMENLERDDNGLVATFADGKSLETDAFLSATGRAPNTDGLGLENAGVTLGKRGEIQVDENYQSNVPSIHAVGDVTGRVALTPVAIAEAMRFVHVKYGGYGPPVNYDLIPTAVFTHPNVGTVGMTEQQARDKGLEIEIADTTFKPMLHSLTDSEEKTYMKLVFMAGGSTVLGVHMVGPDAGELIQGFAVALAKGATKQDFDAMVGIHPTAAEEFVSMR